MSNYCAFWKSKEMFSIAWDSLLHYNSIVLTRVLRQAELAHPIKEFNLYKAGLLQIPYFDLEFIKASREIKVLSYLPQ